MPDAWAWHSASLIGQIVYFVGGLKLIDKDYQVTNEVQTPFNSKIISYFYEKNLWT